MKCYGDYKGDRTCELCEIANNKEFKGCKGKHDEKIELFQKLYDIESKCPYRKTAWDEHNKFYACNKDGHGYGRHADDCKCTLECSQYIMKHTENIDDEISKHLVIRRKGE